MEPVPYEMKKHKKSSVSFTRERHMKKNIHAGLVGDMQLLLQQFHYYTIGRLVAIQMLYTQL